MVDADILPTLLLLLDHSNSAVQTNAAWALMVRGEGEGRRRGREGRATRRGGEGRGREGRGGEGRQEGEERGGEGRVPVLMNVVNNVDCFGSSVEPVTPRYRGSPSTAFRELNNTTPYKVRLLLVYT